LSVDEPSRQTETRRRKAQSREKRRRRRDEHAYPYSADQRPRLPLIRTHVKAARPIETALLTDTLPHTNGAYTGGRESRTTRQHYRLEDLVGAESRYGFELVHWDGRTVRPITDDCGRVIAVLCGAPDDSQWHNVQAGAAAAIAEAREELSLTVKDRVHRRGDFPALAVGISYGGGQKRPQKLAHSSANARVLEQLVQHEHIKRIAAFGSSVFRTWAPRLYEYYAAHMQSLLAHDGRL
ncbi:uncharacterized protein C8Q71DRAFT_690084, partial [Rhodofomes roseus]